MKRIYSTFCFSLLMIGSLFCQTWSSISSGLYHSLAIQTDGTLWAWGTNTDGELGIGNDIDQTAPVQVGEDTNWKSVSCGYGHTLAIKTDGTLWAWGYNDKGQLGLGNNTNQNVPVQVGTSINWISVSGGNRYTLAIKTDGTLWAWGYNGWGQLGAGNFIDQNAPLQVGQDTDWQSAASGFTQTLAIKTNGTLWAWGNNETGQLGLGYYSDVTFTRVQVGTDTNWQSVSLGEGHSLAIKTDGTLWASGDNWRGQLGIGNNTTQNVHIQVGTGTNWKSVSCGAEHSLAIKTDGTLWAWGYNDRGQLGNGNNINQNSPVQVGTGSCWQCVSCGGNQTLAIKGDDGSLWAWGFNEYGQLGIGTTTHQNVPVLVGGAVTPVPLAVNATTTSNTICAGTSTTLNAEASGSSGAFTYSWSSSPEGFSSASQALEVNPTVNTTYRVTVSDGCTSLTDDITITVHALPDANAGNDVSIPPGQSANLTANGGSTYLWSTGETSAAITVSPVVNTQYFVTVTNDDGCTDTDEVWVSIDNASTCTITATIITVSESELGANNGAIIIEASCTGTCGILQYSLNGATPVVDYVFAGLASGIYSVVISNVGAASCSLVESATINVYNPPACDINVSALATHETAVGANDGTITATAICTGTCGTLEYSLNGGGPQASNVFTNLAPGEYTIVVSNSVGAFCSNNSTITINAATPPPPGDLYVLLATADKVALQGAIIHSGGVGVMTAGEEAEIEDESDITAPGTFVKAPAIDVDNSSMVTNQILELANPILPAFLENNTTPNNEVEVDEGETMILTGSVYEDIEVDDDAILIFSGASEVYIEDLKTKDNVQIIFEQCTKLIISGKMNLGKDNQFNKENTQDVTVFAEKSITINKRNEVYATLYSNDKLIVKKSSSYQRTKMHGLFIAEKVESDDYVEYWAQSIDVDCQGTNIAPLIVNNGTITAEPSKAAPLVNEDKSQEVAQQVTIKNLSFLVYPNPATDRVTLKVDEELIGKAALVQLFNQQGQMQTSKNFTNLDDREIEFDLGNYGNGVYMLMVQTDNSRPIMKTFLLTK